MQTILITGASGFIGSNFINEAKGFFIKEVSLRKVSIENIDFAGVDVVLHLAALVHQMRGAPEEAYFKVNHELTIKLAEQAKEKGVKQFIFMSTAKVFGESSLPNTPFTEDTDCQPCDAYGKSKRLAEIDLLKMKSSDFTISIIRTPIVYGIGVKANMNTLISIVRKMLFIPLGKIKNARSIVFTGNLNALIIKIIQSNKTGIFHASDPKSVSTSEIITYIVDGLNKKIFLIPIPTFLIKIIGTIKPSIVQRLYGSFEISNQKTNEILNHQIPFSTKDGFKIMVKNL